MTNHSFFIYLPLVFDGAGAVAGADEGVNAGADAGSGDAAASGVSVCIPRHVLFFSTTCVVLLSLVLLLLRSATTAAAAFAATVVVRPLKIQGKDKTKPFPTTAEEIDRFLQTTKVTVWDAIR